MIALTMTAPGNAKNRGYAQIKAGSRYELFCSAISAAARPIKGPTLSTTTS